jgi:hypothetical protein
MPRRWSWPYEQSPEPRLRPGQTGFECLAPRRRNGLHHFVPPSLHPSVPLPRQFRCSMFDVQRPLYSPLPSLPLRRSVTPSLRRSYLHPPPPTAFRRLIITPSHSSNECRFSVNPPMAGPLLAPRPAICTLAATEPVLSYPLRTGASEATEQRSGERVDQPDPVNLSGRADVLGVQACRADGPTGTQDHAVPMG